MKKTTFKFFFMIFMLHAVAALHAQDPQKAKMTPFGRGYLEYLPAGYETSTEKYPAIIFLHGSGERGTGTAADLEKVKANGPPKHIKNGHKMGFTVNGKTEYFIVLSPQTNDWSWKYDVSPFVAYALQNYKIDPDRVYLTGLSMGGEGTWFGASLEDNNPNYYAAIGVMCGRANVSDGTNVATKKVAVWAFHGDADTAIPIAAGQRPITGMTTAKATPAPIFTIIPGGTHATAWDQGYRTDHTFHNPNLYEWFLAQKRSPASPPPNAAPVVTAEADKALTLPSSTTTLTAAASDTDGSIATYAWTKVSGPAATLTNATASTLSVSNMSATGTYTFAVTVTDNQSATATDEVVVTVNPEPANILPVVEAGVKQTITLPVSTATFTAVASDADGSIVSYSWKRIGGSGVIVMAGTNTSTLVVSGVVASTYVFRLEVKDNMGGIAADTVRLKVNPLVAGRMSTSSDEEIESEEERTVTLGQNYPNPFTTQTTIPFSIDQDQRVVIKLYNTNGVEVNTLLNDELSAGQHIVNVDASTFGNSSRANAIYYYKLYTRGKVTTKQLVLIQ